SLVDVHSFRIRCPRPPRSLLLPYTTLFRSGGARVAVETAGGLGAQPSLASQVGAYLGANGGSADPNALYSVWGGANDLFTIVNRSEEHTSELQSRENLVCRLLLEKKKKRRA